MSQLPDINSFVYCMQHWLFVIDLLQAAAVEAERRRKEAKRAREEAAALESIRRQLEAARAAQARKQAEAAAAMAKTLAENEAHIAARRQAENEQKKRDEALMQETIRTLEKQVCLTATGKPLQVPGCHKDW